MIYETDTDLTLIYNGSAWKAVSRAAPSTNGSVLQVVNATYSVSTSTSSSSAIDTGLTATITPLFSSSKILVNVQQSGLLKQSSNTALLLSLYRNTTEVVKFSRACFTDSTGSASGNAGLTWLDSPATTSATTYKTMFLSTSATGTVTVQWDSMVSTITLMEIAG